MTKLQTLPESDPGITGKSTSSSAPNRRGGG